MVQVHHTVHNCGGVGCSELLLDDPASAGLLKPFGAEHFIVTVERELSIRKGSNVGRPTPIVLSFEDFNSSLAFGRITLHISCRDPGTILFSGHKLDIFSNNRYKTCSKLGDHADQGIIVINIERSHVGSHEKAAGDNCRGLKQVHSKRAVMGVQSLL